MPKPFAPPPKKYGHDRDGSECAYEVCGGNRFDPCTYSPEETERLDRLALEEWEAQQGRGTE